MTREQINKLIEETPEHDGWPEPDMRLINGYRQDAAPFSLQAFGPVWSDWIIKSAEGKGAPPDYIAAGLLSCASVLIGNACRVSPWPSWKEPTILWLCNVGNPSSGKTPGLSAPLDLIRDLEAEINEGFEGEMRDFERRTEEAKAAKDRWKEEVKKANKLNAPAPMPPEKAQEPECPIRKRLLACDATVEILAPLVAKNLKGILYFRDELSGWLEGMNQYKGKGGADRAFWLEAFNGNPFTVDRVKFGVNGSIWVPSLSISVIGGIQPDKLQRALLDDADDGLAARFLYVWPEPVPPRKPLFQADNVQAMANLRKLQKLPLAINEKGQPVPAVISLAESALPHFEEYRQDIHREEQAANGLYLSYMGKNGGRALRLALILEMLWWCAGDESAPPDTVSEDALLYALGMVMDYFDPMARRAFDNAALPPEVRNAVTIAKWIMRAKPERINSREIQRASLGGMDNAEGIKAALEELQNAHWIKPDPDNRNTGGRPRNDYLINPKIWELI